MNSTSASLLIQLKNSRDQEAWARFVQLYTPLIFYWARKTGLQVQDATDVVQEVLAIVFQKIPDFQYEPNKSFRGWLRTITLNKHRELCRKKSRNLADVSQSSLLKLAVEKAESTWDLDYRQALVSQALELVHHDFQPKTWAAVREFVLGNKDAASLAKKHGVSVWTIYAAKSRLMNRLRQVLDGLLD